MPSGLKYGAELETEHMCNMEEVPIQKSEELKLFSFICARLQIFAADLGNHKNCN